MSSPSINELKKYEDEFSEGDFWDKLKEHARDIGEDVVYKALVLFYAMKDGDCDLSDRLMILGALGYLILPLDLIPDFIPVAGYGDDAAALLAVYNKISGCVTEEVEIKAREKLNEWFG